MGDSSRCSQNEDEAQKYESIRSRPVTPTVVVKVHTAQKSRRGGTPYPPESPLETKHKEVDQFHVQSESDETDMKKSTDYRPTSASMSKLKPIPEESVEDFHATTDEHGDIFEVSENFQKLKIARNLPGPCSGAGDGPMQFPEDLISDLPNGITIRSLSSNCVTFVPETHRSNQGSRGRPISSGDEIQIYPASIQKSKLSNTPRKKKVKSGTDRKGLHLRKGLYQSLPDELIPEEEVDSDVGGSDRDYRPPSTARSTAFDDFELMRPETASSEILADGTLAREDEQQIQNLKKIFGIHDEDDWYNTQDEQDSSGKNRIRLLTKLFYRRLEKPSTQGILYTHKLMLGGLHNRLEDFVLLSVPPGFNVKMRITRVKKGVAGRLHPVYFMHLERDMPGDRKCLIMIAKKHTLFGGTGYILSTDPAELSAQSEYCVGKISSNFIGTEFTLYGGRSLCSHVPIDKGALMVLPKVERFKEELATVLYDPNVLGFKGPRKIKVIIPKMKNLLEREAVCPRISEETLYQRYHTEDSPPVWCLRNKDPIWNRETHSYILNFAGRVNSASVKNFQIVCEDNEEQILLQFGRASENTFSLDFRYPFCPLQAFAVALTSFDSKLACE